MLRIAAICLIGVTACGCAVQRAMVASDAKEKMVGLSKEQLLACMGAPVNKAVEGRTEVWAYNSGDGRVVAFGSGYSNTNASVMGGPGYASGNASTVGFSSATASRRFCMINVVISDERVTRVNYAGPTGPLLAPGEQCAFAVQNCVQ